LDDKVRAGKIRLETARLLILRVLYAARPIEAGETILLRILNDFHFNHTLDDVRRELDYLRSLGLAEADQDEAVGWWARLTALGIAVVELNAPVPAGSARTTNAASSSLPPPVNHPDLTSPPQPPSPVEVPTSQTHFPSADSGLRLTGSAGAPPGDLSAEKRERDRPSGQGTGRSRRGVGGER
jgi:hypothetical protein